MRKTATATLLASLLLAGTTTHPAFAKDGDVTHLLTLAQLKSYCAAAPTRETRARLSRNDGSSIVAIAFFDENLEGTVHRSVHRRREEAARRARDDD